MTTLIHSDIDKNYQEKLAEIIYNNFIYLKDITELDHNKESIYNLLNNNNLYLLFKDNSLIGYLLYELKFLVDGRFVCYVDYIYVSKKYRSQKFGSLMLDNLILYCKDNDVKYMLLTFDTNDNKLVNFYVKKGFKQDQAITTDFNGNRVFTLYI